MRTLMLCLALLLLATPARADSVAALRALVEALAANGQLSDVQRQGILKALEPEAADSGQPAPQAATPPAPPAPQTPPEEEPAEALRAVWDDGLHFRSGDDIDIHLGGLLQVNFGGLAASRGLAERLDGLEGAGAEFRRVRLLTEGRIRRHFEYVLELDFAGGEVALEDAYVAFTGLPGEASLLVGHQDEPFSLEEVSSTSATTFLERASATALAPGSNTGILLRNTALDERLFWAAGVFQNTGDDGNDFSSARNFDIAARLAGQPWRAANNRLAHLGLAYVRQFRDADEHPARYLQRPEVHFTDARLTDTGDLAARHVDLLGAEAAVVLGRFSAQAEYMLAAPALKDAAPLFHGAYAFVGWFLTEDSRAYRPDGADFGRTKPVRPLDLHGSGLGAWEVALRASLLDLNDDDVRGGIQHGIAAALNWHLNANMKIMLDYGFSTLNNRLDVPDGHVHGPGARVQVAF